MDPLILILEELEKVRLDIDKLEMTLFTMENDPSHHHHVMSSDERYIRLVNEKEMLIKNLCEIRKDLCNKAINMHGNAIYGTKSEDGVITYYIDKANITNSDATSGHNPNNANSNAVDNHKGMAAATTPPVVEHRLHSRDELQLEEYLLKKAELAGIMRDFTDNKSYFVATDGSLVAMTEYQEISKRIKRGEDPETFLQGVTIIYRTGTQDDNNYDNNNNDENDDDDGDE